MPNLHERCDRQVACVEVAARLSAASLADQLGEHEAAAELRAKARRFAELHDYGQSGRPTR